MTLTKKANVKEDNLETIGFQLFSSDMSIGDDGNALIASFLQKASKIIEEEINEAGGVGGKILRIHYEHLPKGDAGVDKLLSIISSRTNTLFMNGHIASRLNQNIIDGLDLDSLIMLSYQLPSPVSTRPKEFHPNIFNVGRGAEQAKSASIKNILQQNSSKSSRVLLCSFTK